ncbi:MAG: hypothetical protein SPK09_02585 [Porphyromonas sp.]|nr:hypothetical protein [Porphyromonas sp.]
MLKRGLGGILWLFCTLLSVACSKESAAIHSEQLQAADAVPLSVSLEATADEEQFKAISFELKNDGPALLMSEEDVNSVVVISNRSKSSVYYSEIKWKKKTGVNTLSYEGTLTDLATGQPIRLSSGQEWFMMGYLGGTYDKTSKRVKFDPNAGARLRAMAQGDKVDKAVPIYFPWIRLSVSSSGDALNKSIRFMPLGLMLRVQLTNKNVYDVRYRSLHFQSHVLSTGAGYYDLSGTRLPRIPNDPASEVGASAPWVAEGTTEPKYTFQTNAGMELDVVLKAGATYDKTFLVWAMPHNSTDARKTKRTITHLLADAVRVVNGQEQTTPKMESVYIWGSTKMPVERKRVLLKTSLLRVKQPLEYFAYNYVSTSPQSSNPIASGSANIGTFTYNQMSSGTFLGTSGTWRVPSLEEARALFHNVGDWLRFDSSMKTGRASDIGPHRSTDNVRINNETASYTDVYYNGGTIYALRFFGNGQKYYSAWRYTYPVKNPVEIECIYLGPHFKGDIDDVRQASFWDNLHRQDYIKRTYSAVRISDTSQYRYTYPGTWVKGSISPYTRIAWAFGTPERNYDAGLIMSPHAVVDRDQLQNYGRIVYWDVKMPVIPLERNASDFRQ